MKPIQILMPMAGLGARFQAKGYAGPKPLIEVRSQPLFARSLSSLKPLGAGLKLIAVIRRELEINGGLAAAITRHSPRAEVVLLDAPTGGATETCLAAANLLDPDAPLIILDCDVYFESAAYCDAVARAMDKPDSCGGVLVTHRSRDPRFSFVELLGDRVVRTAEKNAISDRAIIGSYFFSRARSFVDASAAAVTTARTTGRESYVSLVYNELIARGALIRATEASLYESYGTPEELEAHR